ncbi:MAG: rhamnulokinase [Anaerolineaceae bacterium]|nr:rhamnulokinase [Anaerolineaceae bacterium]
MAKSINYLAIDLGAESGRTMLGVLDEKGLSLSEISRFSNGPVRLPDGLHWDVLKLWGDIKAGMRMAAAQHPADIQSIGMDTWGVDFALLDRHGSLISNPYHYRDGRTDGMMAEAFQRMPREQLFELTGIQFMQINTLYQLLAMVTQQSSTLETANTFLMIPDLFNYWLSGQIACEETDTTTTQCYDPINQDWAYSLLEAMNIPARIFPKVVQPGNVLGMLLPDLAEETGVGQIPVIATASHDTGSAVAAIPAQNSHFAWISSGTWSIMGVEVPEPVINPQTLAYNLTNEGGVAGTWRLSKNIMGLWLVQECRRTWNNEGEDLSYDEITHLAAQAEPFQAVIDPDYEEFLPPGDMPNRIRAYCKRTGQTQPQTKGAVLRCALESIALKYRLVLEQLETVLGYHLNPIHIIGGGTKNNLLNQFAADATGRTIVTGPVEATAIGNIIVQATALGQFTSIQDARKTVQRSFPLQIFEPKNRSGWDDVYGKLSEVMKAHD